jgi:FkbM family methyltransferase
MRKDPLDRRSFVAGIFVGGAGTAAAALAGRSTWADPGTAAKPRGRSSFAECGEDLVVHDLAHRVLRLQKPTYLDIGAADPVRANNTYLLYCTGSRGVLVEPNPTLAARLRAERPGDTVVAAGIGVSAESEADYYIVRGRPELNTFSAGQAAMLRKTIADDIVERVVKMPLLPINRVMDEQFGGKAPDVMSIDVEGLDLAILRTLDFDGHRPGVICVETIVGSAGTNHDITDLLVSRGYVIRGGSHINTVFVDAARMPA